MNSLTVTVPPRSKRLVSLVQVKQLIGITGTENDALFRSLIDSASSMMVEFLGVDPIRQSYREVRHLAFRCREYLQRIPVEKESLSISLDGDFLVAGEETDVLTGEADYCLTDPRVGEVLVGWDGFAASLSVVTYFAGFVAPEDMVSWAADSAYSVGSFVVLSGSLFMFECTTAGTSASSEPAWPTELGETVTDGSCIWTARSSTLLPAAVSGWCYTAFLKLYAELNRTPGLASYEIDGVSESFFATQTSDFLPPGVQSGLRSWRHELGMVGVS